MTKNAPRTVLLALGALLWATLGALGQAAQPVNVGCLNSAGAWVPWFTADGTWRCAGATIPVSATLTGSTSNATSGQATTATNIPTVAYTYGFNGATWDQFQVDGSKNLKVVFGAAQTVTANQGAANATPWNQNVVQWASQALGAMANYGTSPGAVLVPGVNAFITNTPTVTANAGTNLNTSALALETGGNLAQVVTDFGAPGSVACATDTASCNLNQQMQRLAQRLTTLNTTLGSPFQAGGSIGNTVFGANPAAAATGGATPGNEIAPNNTTGINLKGSAGTVYGIQLGGIGSAPAYLKLYDKATAPTCGTDTPIKRLIIPAAATAANGAGSNIAFPVGVKFTLGIGYCVTTGIGDADTTAPAASTFLVNIDWN